MARSTAMKDALAQAWANQVGKMSIHTGDPGTTGANDSGITHVTVTWPSGPSGGVITSDPLMVTIPADTVMTNVGFWTSAGAYLDSVVDHVTFPTTTTYTFQIVWTST